MFYYFIYFLMAIALIFFDYKTKLWAIKYLKNKPSIELIKNVFNLTYVKNHGAAFGILQNQKLFFIIITIISVLFMAYYFFSSKINWLSKLGIIFIFSGTIGNFINRIFYSYVIDFIEFAFINFPVFNLADIFLITGFIILSSDFLFNKHD